METGAVQIDLNSGIMLVGVVQGLFLALTLAVQKQGPRLANFFLIGLLLSFVLALLVHWLTLSDAWEAHPHLYLMGSPVIFLFGPMLYFYVRQLSSPSAPLRSAHLAHLLPYLLNLAAFLPLFMLEPDALVDRLIQAPTTTGRGALLPMLKLLAVTTYTLMALGILRHHHRRITAFYADIEAINLRWLKTLTFAFLSLETFLIIVLVSGADLSQLPGRADTALAAFIVLLIFLTGFKGLHQPALFRGVDTDLFAALNATEHPVKKVVRSEMGADEIARLDARLEQLFREEQIHLDPILDMRKLAHKARVTTHKLSHYLNEHQGHSFYDYVNSHRLAHAKALLLGSDDAILDIAYASGFNNKATFNKAFKKETGLTPSEFRLKNQ